MFVLAVSWLDHLGQAAAVILLLELLVIILIFLGISGGLAFGLWWVNGKTGWAFNLVNTYFGKGRGFIHTGTDYAAKPFILASGFAERARVTAEAVRKRIRDQRAAAATPSPVASRPVPPPETVEEPEGVAPLT